MTNPVSGGFQLTPATGLNDTATYPTTPVNETTARQQFMDMYWQLMNEMNSPTLSAAAYAQYNKLINGNFDVWQRGTSFSVGTGSPYTADRWQAYRAALVAGMTVSRQDGSGVNGSNYCLRAQRDSGNTATNILQLAQALESGDSLKFRGKKVTLSFYARAGANYSATNSQISAYLGTGTGTDNSVLSVTGYATPINASATLTTNWQKFSFTTSSVLANTVNQLFAQFTTNTLSGTAGANDYFEITQVQVNAGDQALPFQPRSFTDELVLCQRYYEKTYSHSVSPGTVDSNGIVTAYASSGYIIADGGPFKVSKRVAPTMTVYSSYSGASGNATRFEANSTDVAVSGMEKTSTNRSGRLYLVAGTAASGNWQWHWTADAEL